MLMRDPRIQQVLKDFQENPKAAQDAMKDSFIGEAINKLIAAGVIKMAWATWLVMISKVDTPTYPPTHSK